MHDRHPTLIASPQVSFVELGVQLAQLGWKQDSATDRPLLSGEPELAVFIRPMTQARIHYTFNPVVKFRVLQFHGSDAPEMRAQAANRIPVVGEEEIRTLLTSADVRQILLGLFAAEELAELGVARQVGGLTTHHDPKVARTAARVLDSLVRKAASEAARQLATAQEKGSLSAVVFSGLVQPELRKQVLRWIIRGSQGSNQSIDQVLRAALQDPDPEVRVTAVLAAARLRAKNLIPELRKAELPTSTSLGADERDRFFYEKLRQTTVRYLLIEARFADQQPGEKLLQFQKAISGTLTVQDDATLLLHSLMTPVQLGDKPSRLPDGVEEHEDGYRLRRSGLALRWVAPIEHWLGEDSARAPVPNPVRQVHPFSGFFIAECPVSSRLASWTPETNRPAPPLDPVDSQSFLCGCEEAVYLCELLGHSDGVQLRLPTADQWEMAARGPDGRRYPWGNSLRQDGVLQPSPWRVKATVGHDAEWTTDQGPQYTRIVCGGSIRPCARRQPKRDSDRVMCAVRPVLIWKVE
jgi:hypothetical protein